MNISLLKGCMENPECWNNPEQPEQTIFLRIWSRANIRPFCDEFWRFLNNLKPLLTVEPFYVHLEPFYVYILASIVIG